MESLVRKQAEKYVANLKDTGGGNLRGDCPFHESKPGSKTFSISLATGMWFCFHADCNSGGGFVSFLRKVGCSDAVVTEAVNSFEELPLSAHAKTKALAQQKVIYLPEYILGAYRELPPGFSLGKLSAETLKAFDIGFDHPNKRIVFPVRDHLGRLVAVSGRATEPAQLPRYKVYTAEPPHQGRRAGEFYGTVEGYRPDNRKYLYGFHTIYPERFYQPKEHAHIPILLTEGFKSTMWPRQCSPRFKHTAGLQGSTLSDGQRRQLARVRGPYIVLLDFEAGKMFPDKNRRCAAIQIAQTLMAHGDVKLGAYPPGKPLRTSPDDLSEDELHYAVDHAKSATELLLS